MSELPLTPARIDVFHLEAPLKTPRSNAFGTMYARPALLVRLTDASGHEGWGEVFCNWPAFAAAHRKKIIEQILAPKLIGQSFAGPSQMWQFLTEDTHALALQANEPGPFEQSIAGLDIAAWDMTARREDRPLYDVLAPGSKHDVPAYASALTAQTLDTLVPALTQTGWRGFKVKVGFGANADRAALDSLRRLVGDAAVMVDANQAWTPDEAIAAGQALAEFELLWIEEPIAADRPHQDWHQVANAQPVHLAAGENLRKVEAFRAAANSGVAILQPDAIKWGGLSGLIAIHQVAAATSAAFAPHFLGSGIGLVATAHAAIALGASWLEVDVTENPLRVAFSAGAFDVENGLASVTDRPGLGIVPDAQKLSAFSARS
uniref:mandelate racemase/muconate lactonizing enzyme family protein n=1 Tax=Pararhizobium sp. IMCC3301 TaxID=3067904 RepID=UPI002740DC30|nr:mandelate racemase/muconate lactonizing enzyme family protein [Pararhizobium sp. IMCC3301]